MSPTGKAPTILETPDPDAGGEALLVNADG